MDTPAPAASVRPFGMRYLAVPRSAVGPSTSARYDEHIDRSQGSWARLIDRFPLGLAFDSATPQHGHEPSSARPFGLRFVRPWNIQPIDSSDHGYDEDAQVGIGPRTPTMSKYPKITYTNNNTDTDYDPDPQESD